MARRGWGRSSRYDNYGYGYGGFPPYVSVGEKRARAAREVAKLSKKGEKLSPVVIEGRTIARTFWGKAWCTNLESYSDYENRLPRGRSYVSHGAVIDLQIGPGTITALVSGTSLYTVEIGIKPLAKARWNAVVAECAGKIDSVVELLQGKLSKGVMEVIARKGTGLFPEPREITLKCSCPDWATMCKHVAATLYGVGARLDASPELLFRLRGVDEVELIGAASATAIADVGAQTAGAIADDDLTGIFGIELDGRATAKADARKPARASRKKQQPAPAVAEPMPRHVRVARGAKPAKPSAAERERTIAATVAAIAPRSGRKVTSQDLIVHGVDRSRIQSWLQTDVLERTDERGVYRTTTRTAKKLRDYLTALER